MNKFEFNANESASFQVNLEEYIDKCLSVADSHNIDHNVVAFHILSSLASAFRSACFKRDIFSTRGEK